MGLVSDRKRLLGLSDFVDCRLESLANPKSQSCAPGDSMIYSGLVNNSEKSAKSSTGIPGPCSADPKTGSCPWVRTSSSSSNAKTRLLGLGESVVVLGLLRWSGHISATRGMFGIKL